MNAFWCLLAFLVGLLFGWLIAHHTVANECEKLGRFYVGKTKFECRVITNATASPTGAKP